MKKLTFEGFSKLDKKDKINQLIENKIISLSDQKKLEYYCLTPCEKQEIHDSFSENTISNFILPFSIAPHFLIDDIEYVIPMVTEESSVVAAAAAGAKFWKNHGGFTTKVYGKSKSGQVHFFCQKEQIKLLFQKYKDLVIKDLSPILSNMEKRGGGITNIELIDNSDKINNYYVLNLSFETCDSMGANFINTCLEKCGELFKFYCKKDGLDIDILMAILSNYTPECLVESSISCSLKDFILHPKMSADESLDRFLKALKIADIFQERAITHNKGIMNGIDAVVIATGNDFRAVEANAHAFACKQGSYKSLSSAIVKNDKIIFSLKVPMNIGTIGGVTRLHPMAKIAIRILKNPSATKLMGIIASAGLAQNFSAIRSLVTVGIQKGHMKMHLINILKQIGATKEQINAAIEYFKDKPISNTEVSNFIKYNA